jgi:hypothetical protein
MNHVKRLQRVSRLKTRQQPYNCNCLSVGLHALGVWFTHTQTLHQAQWPTHKNHVPKNSGKPEELLQMIRLRGRAVGNGAFAMRSLGINTFPPPIQGGGFYGFLCNAP